MGTAIGLGMAGWRPVCEMQYDAFSYPALDQLINSRRALPLADARRDGVPDHRPHAVRRRRACARAARRLARDVLRPHARREGRDPVDARATPRACSPPRSAIPTRWSSSSRSSTTGRFAARCPTASTSCRSGRRGSRARAPTSRSSPTARWCRWPRRRPTTLAGEASVEVLDLRSLKPLDEDALLASAAKTGRVVVVQEAPRVCGLRCRGRSRARGEGDSRPSWRPCCG